MALQAFIDYSTLTFVFGAEKAVPEAEWVAALPPESLDTPRRAIVFKLTSSNLIRACAELTLTTTSGGSPESGRTTSVPPFSPRLMMSDFSTSPQICGLTEETVTILLQYDC